MFIHPAFADEKNSNDMDIGRLSYEQVLEPFLCQNCLMSCRTVEAPFCPVCGMPDKQGKKTVCENCRSFPRYFSKCRSFGFYEGSLQNMLHRYKYHRKTFLARPLGLLLFSVFARYWNPEESILLMPVPLHKNKFRKRGFNQSWLMLRDWPDLARKYFFPSLQPDRGNLIRIRETKSQTHMPREMRLRNVRGAFSVRWPEKVRGKKILLADDVFTTGATANECAKVLIQAGAAQVDVISFARPLLYP
ncbi:MAG: ComF family protein [Desulfococcaceae bacterium]|nr:ComF family protein [Desulfococcaceae bacterium]